MSPPDAIAAELVALGLTRNESLGYLCLLEAEESLGLTGYEVAARSGIPRSAVYGVLRKLQDGGWIFPTGDQPARYAPVPARDVLAGIRLDTLDRLAGLEESLGNLTPRSQPEPVWILNRYDRVLEVVAAAIGRAEHSLCLSLWQRELLALEAAVASAVSRGVHVLLHSIDPALECPPGAACWADRDADDRRRTWSHKLIAVVDRREAIMGGAEPGANNQAVHTRNPSLVDLATNHIVLDVTLIARALGRDPGSDVAPLMRPHLSS